MEEAKSTQPQTAKANSAVYKISPRYEYKERMITLTSDGERINLTGKDTIIKKDATVEDPRTEIKVRGATQEDLKNHFEKGHQDIVIKIS